MDRCYLSTIEVIAAFSLHVLLWIVDHLKLVRRDAKAQLMMILYYISIAGFLRVMVTIDRVYLVVKLIAHISFLQLIHCLCINHVRAFITQIIHDIG